MGSWTTWTTFRPPYSAAYLFKTNTTD